MSNITVYSKPGCMQCLMTKKHLDKIGAEYSIIDIAEDQKAFDHVVNDLGERSMPVVETSDGVHFTLSLIHISEPTRLRQLSRMPSSA